MANFRSLINGWKLSHLLSTSSQPTASSDNKANDRHPASRRRVRRLELEPRVTRPNQLLPFIQRAVSTIVIKQHLEIYSAIIALRRSGLNGAVRLDKIHDQKPVAGLQDWGKGSDDVGGVLVRVIEESFTIKICVRGRLLWLEEIMHLEREPVLKLGRNNRGLGVLGYLHDLGPVLDDEMQFWRGLGNGDGAVAHVTADINHGPVPEQTPVESVLDVFKRRRRLLRDLLDRGSEPSLPDRIGADEVVERPLASVRVINGGLVGLLRPMAPFLHGVDLMSDHGRAVLRQPLHERLHRMAFFHQQGANGVSDSLGSRLVENPIGDCKADVLLQLRGIHPGLLGQGQIIDFARLGNVIRDLVVADISHGPDPLQLAKP